MTRVEAKENAKRRRRRIDRQIAEDAKGPWTDADPQPGDFDAELDAAQPGQIEMRPGNADAQLHTLGAPASPESDHGD